MRRRTKGTGGLRLRGRVWWIHYYDHGERKFESAETEDEGKARNLLLQRIGEIAAGAGREVTAEKATVNDLYGLVVADYRLRGLRDLPTVKLRYEAHVKPALGHLLASRFSTKQAREYASRRQTESASNATINRELAIVRRGYSLGLEEDPPLVRRAPRIPKLEESDPRQGFIEQTEYRLLLSAMPDHLKCLLVVGYHCGCRLGELRKLRWSQVDTEAAEIRIERKQAKGKQPRTIPIYGEMAEWLEWQRERTAGDLVFAWRQPAKRVIAKEKPLGSHLKGWAAACTAAELPGLHFHDLRRSAVRNMERAGIPRSVAMKISGHRTESVYRRYDIVAQADLQAAGKKLADYHKQAPKLRRVK